MIILHPRRILDNSVQDVNKQTNEMAVEKASAWPNNKDDYELRDVIG